MRFLAFPGFKASGAVPADLHKIGLFVAKVTHAFLLSLDFYMLKVLVENI